MRVCGIAGFLLFELKSAESVENAGIFRGDTGWHPVCKKTFWFSAVPCGRILSSACFGRSPLIILGQRGVVLGGCFGKRLCKPAKNFQQSHAICSCEDSYQPRCTAAVQKDLSLSYRNMRGEKTTRFFRFSQNFFSASYFCPTSMKDCRLCRPCLQNG